MIYTGLNFCQILHIHSAFTTETEKLYEPILPELLIEHVIEKALLNFYDFYT